MKNQDMIKFAPQKQRGNVVLFLLVAIFLLGALTALLVRSAGTTNDTGEVEGDKITASGLMSYAAGVETAVQAMLSRGCSEGQISFRVGSEVDYNNTGAPANNSCHVFHVNGGGQTRRFFDDVDAVSGIYGVENLGTDAPELMFNHTVPRATCEQINIILGIPNTGAEGPPTDAMGGGTKFTGSYGPTPTNAEKMNTAPFDGRKSGCRHQSGSGATAIYIFYHVLNAR